MPYAVLLEGLDPYSSQVCCAAVWCIVAAVAGSIAAIDEGPLHVRILAACKWICLDSLS